MTKISRREILGGVGAGALGVGALGALAPEAAASGTDTVRGSWQITPKLPPGAPPFVALAAFAAGGVFITTGSDEPGTGIGEWRSIGSDGFGFAYTNFHFDSAGKLSSVVNVKATGTFHRSRLSGQASERRLDPSGHQIGSTLNVTFTGSRLSS